MMHLTDEQLVEHFLNEEGANRVVVETHLRICSRCEQAYEEISNAMEVRHPEPPARESGYGERVWQAIEQPLRPYPAKAGRNGWFTWPRMVLLAACLAGLAAAFFGGSIWERSRNHLLQAGNSAQAPAQAKERVVLLILDDHLERSERLLVQLNHAGGADANELLQAEARQLLPDNRLYRQTIAENGDPSMSAALDHLERVLQEIANSPDKLNGADLERIEQEMNTDSLLFQIRVLRARTARTEQKLDTRKGASI